MVDQWQSQLKHGLGALKELVERGMLPEAQARELAPVAQKYAFFVTEHYLNLVDFDDPLCPIGLQAIPNQYELDAQAGELGDPIGDDVHEAIPGVVHRYPDRALLFLTLQCPLLCRFCFRKVFLNEESPVSFSRRLTAAVEYFETQSSLREIVLSGGDPFLLSDRRIAQIVEQLKTVNHIKAVRLHTRVLAALPSRVTEELAAHLDRSPLSITVVAHVNHPKEWTTEAHEAAQRLKKAGVQLLSQSVLMKNVNDSPAVLRELFLTLSDSGCTPYYLHHPDLTVGTQHFRVALRDGMQIMRTLRGTMPGHTIPTYILDLPGGFGKIPVDSSYLKETKDPAIWNWTSPHGETGRYRDLALS